MDVPESKTTRLARLTLRDGDCPVVAGSGRRDTMGNLPKDDSLAPSFLELSQLVEKPLWKRSMGSCVPPDDGPVQRPAEELQVDDQLSDDTWTTDAASTLSTAAATRSASAGCKKICWADGTFYTGHVNGKRLPHGEGRMTLPSGEYCEGHWADGRLFGWIAHAAADGSFYEGHVKDNMRHGFGKLRMQNGARYEGDWLDDKPHGEGRFTNETKEITYAGQWFAGAAFGIGTLTSVGWGTYSGEWRHNVRHGYGTAIFTNGDKYEGQWKQDRPSGDGVFTWVNGDRFVGSFADGQFSGTGTLSAANGQQLSGHWEAGQINGRGFMKFADGAIYDGEWRGSRPHGEGRFLNPYGVLFRGRWKDGVFEAIKSGFTGKGLCSCVIEGDLLQARSGTLDERLVVPCPPPGSGTMPSQLPRPRCGAKGGDKEESQPIISRIYPNSGKYGSDSGSDSYGCGAFRGGGREGYIYTTQFLIEYFDQSSSQGEFLNEAPTFEEELEETRREEWTQLLCVDSLPSASTALAEGEGPVLTSSRGLMSGGISKVPTKLESPTPAPSSVCSKPPTREVAEPVELFPIAFSTGNEAHIQARSQSEVDSTFVSPRKHTSGGRTHPKQPPALSPVGDPAQLLRFQSGVPVSSFALPTPHQPLQRPVSPTSYAATPPSLLAPTGAAPVTPYGPRLEKQGDIPSIMYGAPIALHRVPVQSLSRTARCCAGGHRIPALHDPYKHKLRETGKDIGLDYQSRKQVNHPLPVEAEVRCELRLPQLRVKRVAKSYPVYAPRFIEVPVPAENLSLEDIVLCEEIQNQLANLQKGVGGCQLERLADSVRQLIIGDAATAIHASRCQNLGAFGGIVYPETTRVTLHKGPFAEN